MQTNESTRLNHWNVTLYFIHLFTLTITASKCVYVLLQVLHPKCGLCILVCNVWESLYLLLWRYASFSHILLHRYSWIDYRGLHLTAARSTLHLASWKDTVCKVYSVMVWGETNTYYTSNRISNKCNVHINMLNYFNDWTEWNVLKYGCTKSQNHTNIDSLSHHQHK